MARKARSNVAGFRKLLLAALVLCLVAIVGLFMFGRAGRQRDRSPKEQETADTKGLSLIGEDFDYTFTEGPRPIFHIKGDSVKADREGTIYLDRVAMTLWDKQGRIFHVESRNGTFNRESNEGTLQGNVVLRGPDGLELHSAQVSLQQKGNQVVSEVPVEIHYGDKYVAHAGRMDIDINAEVYTLQKGSRVESLPGAVPPVLLVSQRLVYDRKQRWLRVEGGANLRRGADWLAARRIYANLSPDEKSLIFVHGFWDVEGETHAAALPGAPATPAAAPTTVRFSGAKDLAVLLRPQGNEVKHVELTTDDPGKVQMRSTGGGLVRTLTARRIEGTLAEGVLSGANAFGGVEIREIARGGPGGKPAQRQATGQRAVATFKPDGHLATVDLNVNVVYRDNANVTATGNRGSLDLDQGRGEFVGDPVTVTSDRGQIQAPRMVYNTDQQIVNARGGVRALLQKVEETALAGTPLAQGEGPVHVESQEAFWRQQPSSFLFRGDVRAWRGENLLLAPELRGDKAADQLNATGGVKTLWYPTPEQAAKATVGGQGGKKPGGAAARPNPIQVAASDMQFQQKAGVLIYTGNVRVDQEGKTITCQRMQVDLTQEHQAKTMTCTGDTKVNDPKVGRRIEGQRAVYQVSQRQVEIFGEPVVMNDRDGNQVRGKRVLYFVDDGRAVVQGKEGEVPAAPTGTPVKPAQGEQGKGSPEQRP
jgi:lipopolysaccharide transport protein LptA/LPS export ABC transporter protein LptC